MRPWNLLLSLLLLLLLHSACAFFVRWPEVKAPAVFTSRDRLGEASRVRAWQEDTDAVRERLLSKHPNPFFKGTREAFESEYRRLRTEIPTLEDRRIVLRWMQWVRLLGDEHTFVEAPWVHREGAHYPFLLADFEGVATVSQLGADLGKDQEDLFGCALVAVEGVPVEKLLEACAPGGAASHPAFRRRRALNSWHAGGALDLGLLPDKPTWSCTFRNPQGEVLARELARPKGGEPVWRGPTRTEVPLRHRHPGKVAFLEWLPGAAYLRYRSCEAHTPSLMDLLGEVDAQREAKGASRLVVDLRGNGGGNSGYHWRFQRALASHPQFSKPGNLVVLTDVGTFSSGFLLAWHLKHQAHARILGETSGQPVNAYGDIRFHTLRHTRAAQVGISSKAFFYKVGTPMDFHRFLEPEVRVTLPMRAWLRGEDPVLEAALR